MNYYFFSHIKINKLIYGGFGIMYVDRSFPELNDTPLNQWEMKELAYYHDQLSQLADVLNEQGRSIHQKIIEEITNRGGLPRDEGGWDHPSQIIYD